MLIKFNLILKNIINNYLGLELHYIPMDFLVFLPFVDYSLFISISSPYICLYFYILFWLVDMIRNSPLPLQKYS